MISLREKELLESSGPCELPMRNREVERVVVSKTSPTPELPTWGVNRGVERVVVWKISPKTELPTWGGGKIGA